MISWYVLVFRVFRDPFSANQLPVVEDGRVLGLVSREDILTWLALRRGTKMGLDELRRQ